MQNMSENAKKVWKNAKMNNKCGMYKKCRVFMKMRLIKLGIHDNFVHMQKRKSIYI